MIKIVFFGTPNFAEIILESLINNDIFEVVAIITNPDKLVGRKQVLTASPVKKIAFESGIEVLQPEKLIEQLKKINADVFVVAAYGKIIPKEILEIPKFGCINVHGSLLPKYRGASPIQNVLIDGRKETGVTIMLMDEGMDTGPILRQESIEVNNDDNFSTFSKKMAKLGAGMLDKTLPEWIENEIEPIKQEDAEATYTKLFKSEDYKIDWGKPAEEIHNLVRGLYPDVYGTVKVGEPAFAPTELRTGKEKMRIKILKTKISKQYQISNSQFLNGELLRYNNSLVVFCGNSDLLELLQIQPVGKKVMSGKDFLNGHPLLSLPFSQGGG